MVIQPLSVKGRAELFSLCAKNKTGFIKYRMVKYPVLVVGQILPVV
jgi:hypothetical protein